MEVTIPSYGLYAVLFIRDQHIDGCFVFFIHFFDKFTTCIPNSEKDIAGKGGYERSVELTMRQNLLGISAIVHDKVVCLLNPTVTLDRLI